MNRDKLCQKAKGQRPIVSVKNTYTRIWYKLNNVANRQREYMF